MGALRACEAAAIGMLGFGEVYRWLRLWRADDDEVAQAIDPTSFQALSDAMIDIRVFLSRATRLGLISRDIASEAADLQKAKLFVDRSIASIIESPLLSAGTRAELTSFVGHSAGREAGGVT